jgi:nitroimidazol reductase NimA-like FMN-containing flavoprotein (pyridoxamine 5'-phosphate oxidase superfamily)
MATGTMTVEEREAFLAEVHVGILAMNESERGPLALPVWYTFVNGVVEIGMDGRSLKATLLKAAGRATLTVQTEEPPYKYVSVQGPVTLLATHRDNLAVASRYLGPEVGKWYDAKNPPTEHSILVQLTPETWRTHDFAKEIEN